MCPTPCVKSPTGQLLLKGLITKAMIIRTCRFDVSYFVAQNAIRQKGKKMRKIFVKDLSIGQAIENVFFVLEKIDGFLSDRTRVILSDKSGSLLAEIPTALVPAQQLNSSEYINKVVMVSASILVEKRQPKAVITAFQKAEEGDYKLSDVMPGLSEETVKSLIEDIRFAITKVSNVNYRTLLETVLTEETLLRLSELPYTLGWYGCYRGGALAATSSVTRMSMTSMVSYMRHGNGGFNKPPDWSLMITAGLLHTYGCLDYFDKTEVFKKSTDGINLNYCSTLVLALTKFCEKNSLTFADGEFSALINTLISSISVKTDVRSTTKAGAVLRHIMRLYAECDQLDWEEANNPGAEPMYFSTKLGRYISNFNSESEVKVE